MAMHASDRQFLHGRLREVLGERAGALLMEQFPPVPWDQLATKADLVRLDAKIDVMAAGLRADLRAEMSAGFQKLAVTIVAANTTLFAAMLAAMLGVVVLD